MNLKEYYKERLNASLMTEGKESYKLPTERLQSAGSDRERELSVARRAATNANNFNARYKPLQSKNMDSPNKPPEEYLNRIRTSWRNWTPTPGSRPFRSPRARSVEETAEDKDRVEKTKNLLNTVHYFSRQHGVELNAKHIEGIDFSNPDIQSHVDAISSRLNMQ